MKHLDGCIFVPQTLPFTKIMFSQILDFAFQQKSALISCYLSFSLEKKSSLGFMQATWVFSTGMFSLHSWGLHLSFGGFSIFIWWAGLYLAGSHYLTFLLHLPIYGIQEFLLSRGFMLRVIIPYDIECFRYVVCKEKQLSGRLRNIKIKAKFGNLFWFPFYFLFVPYNRLSTWLYLFLFPLAD